MNKKVTLAVQELKGSLIAKFGHGVELKLFGSVARGDDRKYSDIDLLVLLPGQVDHSVEEMVFDTAALSSMKRNSGIPILPPSCPFIRTSIAKDWLYERDSDPLQKG
jgi:predicted nucleotidyltransferase